MAWKAPPSTRIGSAFFISRQVCTVFLGMFGLFVEFVSVLFIQIRARSIQAVSALLYDKPVIDKILLAKKYHIKEWLFEGYTSLILQDQLNLNQLLLTLDTLTVARLFYIREIILRSQISKPSPLSEAVEVHSWGMPTPPVSVGFQIDVECGNCGRALDFALLEASEVTNHVSREFASEIITW